VKRFWKAADVTRQGNGWGVALDARPLRTPARAELAVPSERLARAIADEWDSVEQSVDPRDLPLTGLTNAAIDHVAPAPEVFAAGLARYAEGDLACYRAEGPPALVERQSAAWDALLDWARRRFDVDFRITSGLIHVRQPEATIDRLTHAVAALDPLHLAGLSPLVTIGGSLVAGLGVLESAFTPEAAWDAVSVDERWQLDQWGSDAEAELALENRKKDFLAAGTFLRLLDQ
jgi:chaperone required for assembly of F1-ATPase